jgi:hypothetical protein
LAKVWKNSEETLCRIMMKTFPGNYCAVAQCLATKTCQQVFAFSTKEGKMDRVRRAQNVAKVRE